MKQGTGKTALVTGAASGIGQELAKLFAQDGFNLILVDHNEEPLHRLTEVFENNYGTETVTVINKDLAREDVAIELYEEVKSKGITVNVLVNNAGISTYGKFATDTDWEREKEVIHLNVLTTTLLTKLFLNDMVARNEGRILQLASMVSVTPFPLMAVYAATKSYVWSLTQSLRNELKDTNVTVTALMPNATATNFFREADAPKLNVEDMMDDPAMVARDGYKALMKGEAKVVPGGLVNKAQEVMAYLSPQETLAGMMRWLLTPKHESNRDGKTPNWAVGLGVVAVAAVAGYALVSAYTNLGPVDKLRYRYKAKWLGNSATNALSSVADSVLGAYHNGKAKVEEALV